MAEQAGASADLDQTVVNKEDEASKARSTPIKELEKEEAIAGQSNVEEKSKPKKKKKKKRHVTKTEWCKYFAYLNDEKREKLMELPDLSSSNSKRSKRSKSKSLGSKSSSVKSSKTNSISKDDLNDGDSKRSSFNDSTSTIKPSGGGQSKSAGLIRTKKSANKLGRSKSRDG